MWEFNNIQIQEAIAIGLLENTSVSIMAFPTARSALIINVEANQDILRGRNEISCSAANAGGATNGRITLEGACMWLCLHCSACKRVCLFSDYNCTKTGVGECSTTCGLGESAVVYLYQQYCVFSSIIGHRPILYTCMVTRGETMEETIPASRVPDDALPLSRTEVCKVTDSFGNFVIW